MRRNYFHTSCVMAFRSTICSLINTVLVLNFAQLEYLKSEKIEFLAEIRPIRCLHDEVRLSNSFLELYVWVMWEISGIQKIPRNSNIWDGTEFKFCENSTQPMSSTIRSDCQLVTRTSDYVWSVCNNFQLYGAELSEVVVRVKNVNLTIIAVWKFQWIWKYSTQKQFFWNILKQKWMIDFAATHQFSYYNISFCTCLYHCICHKVQLL